MKWFYYSISASVFWGFTYAVQERILKKISVLTELALGYLFGFLASALLAYCSGDLQRDMKSLDLDTMRWILIITALSVTANFFIASSIQSKNASLASVIEICYPLFTILASYLINGEVQVNKNTAFGAAIIFSGVALILVG